MRRLLEDHESLMMERFFYDPKFREAIRLRQSFIRELLAQDPRFFKTQEEADWAFVIKREYNYKVVLESLMWSALPFLVTNAAVVFASKTLKWQPLMVLPVAYAGFQKYFFAKYNKRFFDMANLGEEYEIGAKRNAVLRQCNELLGVEDF